MIIRALVSVAALAGLALIGSTPALASQPYPLNYKTFSLGAADATLVGTSFSGGALKLASNGLGTFAYTDPFANANGDGVDGSGNYRYGSWTSGTTALFPFNELVSSWNAKTPAGTWIQVEVQPQIDDGHWAKWYILGRWAYGDSDFHRTSVGGQGDADGFVSIDTFFAKDHLAVAYRLRLTLFRRTGSSATPSITRLSAIASNLVNQKMTFPSKTTMTGTTIDLGVPQYSQEIHHGEFPEFDGGGEAWCSPTSTSMVVQYWGKGPSSADTAFVAARYPQATDPQVDYAARYTFDYHYNGAGNWPFNVAYAGRFGLEGEVTQLHSLREAELFIKQGIPLVASIAFTSNKLDGFLFKSTAGHLLVIVGFTKAGDPIVNDPAATSDGSVQRTYDRTQFERNWMASTGGIVYVIHPSSVPLPASQFGNW